MLESGIKHGTEVNLIGNSNGETNFPHNLSLTKTKVSKICKTSANGSSANIKFSKTQLSKMIQSGGFLTDITGLDNSVNFPFKVLDSYSNKLNNIDTKNIRIKRIIFI